MSALVSGHFLGEPGCRIFAMLRRASAPEGNGCVMVVPPFAEEMNKSRAMVAATATRLVAAGHAVLVPDLYGTGDSEGDFEQASVDRWCADLGEACNWSAGQGYPVTEILGVRLGCALACAATGAGVIPTVKRSVFWQPVLDGERHLTQFLRLRVAAAMMADGHQESVQSLRTRLSNGESLEVAGYWLSPVLADGIDGLKIDTIPAQLGRINWFDVVRNPERELSAASAGFVTKVRAAGRDVGARAIAGDAFWASAEIVRVPELVDATVGALT